jgi:GAF domain-containing protein
MRGLFRSLPRAQSFRLWRTYAADDWTDGPRPPGRALIRAPGRDPLQIFLLGGGPATGYGVTNHELALAGHLARKIAQEAQLGVDMEVSVAPNVTASWARSAALSIDRARYDAVILSVGVQDALDGTRPHAWARNMNALVRHFFDGESGHPQVFVLGVPPVSRVVSLTRAAAVVIDLRSQQLDEQLRVIASQDSVHYVPFVPTAAADAGRHRSSETYRDWATPIAAHISPVLAVLPQSAPRAIPEGERHNAVHALGILDSAPDERFDQIVAAARSRFHATAAVLSFMDADRQWYKSASGVDVTSLPRGTTFSEWTIQKATPFIITDTVHDVRYRNMAVVTEAHVRAYAGHPILDPSGVPVGALSVLFAKPREFSPEDLAFLRRLAAMVESLLHPT